MGKTSSTDKVESISVQCSVQFALSLIVWFQKVSITPPEGSLEMSRGRGVLKAKAKLVQE